MGTRRRHTGGRQRPHISPGHDVNRHRSAADMAARILGLSADAESRKAFDRVRAKRRCATTGWEIGKGANEALRNAPWSRLSKTTT